MITREQIVEIMRNELIVEHNTTIIEGYDDAAEAILALIKKQNGEFQRQFTLMLQGLEGLAQLPSSHAHGGYVSSVFRALENPNIEPCPTCGSVFVSRNPDLEEEKYRFWCYPCLVKKRLEEQKIKDIQWKEESAEKGKAMDCLKEFWPELEWWGQVVATFRRCKSAAGVEKKLNVWLPKRDNSEIAEIIFRRMKDE